MRSKLILITHVINDKNQTTITLNGSQEVILENYSGAPIKSGRFCIICFSSRGKLISLYLIDSKNKPFQIYGTIDALTEGSHICDDTIALLKENAYATQLCVSSFNALSKSQIEENKIKLLEFENQVFESLLSHKTGWKTAKRKIIALIQTVDLQDTIKTIFIGAISIAPMPKVAINKTIELNLEDYPYSKIIRY
jgi:hypothetical protein